MTALPRGWHAIGWTLSTFLISAVGGFIANSFGIPAGWLMGGALGVSVAAMVGLPVMLPRWVRDTAFVMVGLSMGATVPSDTLSLISHWPVTLIAMVIELVLIVTITGWILARFFKLDPGTAYLSSFPGHLSFIMGIASAGVGDARQIAMIQVIRILILTICVPIGALFLPPVTEMVTAGPVHTVPVITLLVLAAACAAIGLVFVRLRIPAGFVLGSMAISTSAKLAGLFEGALPQPLVVVTLIMVGALIGSRFAGITRAEFVRAAFGGIVATLATVGIVTIIAYAASLIVDMPLAQIWLGLSPGALEGMGALGVALGYDTAFIGAHHVIRLLLLSFAIPAVVLWIRRRETRQPRA
ncbi:AbrB family transcriptional regulator [Devosia rhodophyticola]|uniref:AbrB family transcriptional regulator n=1 Tax=Devosia rhodophyticola TaxID=3026423 RepID=A0ABY7YZ57_9HYPH|nr:AbrB family transcriptional regulator [Devosia rhodophyticola]WDR06651.1 AbrB family transcriptional regulator [Devosia rhodophyticola]